jgi:ABC-type nitrate/sulfonate/bicarbonate transport system substrate-binding protein
MSVLVDLASEDYVWPFAAIATRSSYAEDNREQTVNLLKALVEALARWEAEPEAAQEVIATTSRIDDPALVEASYEAVSAVLDQEPIPVEDVMAPPLEAIAETGNEKAGTADAQDFFDDSYIQEALG